MQNKVKRFLDEYDLHCSKEIRYMDLVSEVGELGKEIISGSEYGRISYSNTEALAEEVGDTLFSLLSLCCELEVDAKEALDLALIKYQNRFAEKGFIDSK